MGLRGIENGVTRFHQVRVPAANRLGREGQGLKIALTTLNTGRLSIPALCVAVRQVEPEDLPRMVQRHGPNGARPVGKHEAVGKKIAFIAATTFALEAVFELSAEMADAGQKDVRIEAALAKLWSTELSCRIADELVQIRGGRGFETADSLEARGERAVPAEQQLRDLRINRIFEGSSRNHETPDRPGSRGRPPRRRGRPRLGGCEPAGQGEGRRRRFRFLCEVAAQTGGGSRHGPAVLHGIRPARRSNCGSWKGPRGGWPGRRFTGWAAGRRNSSTSRPSWAGSWTSAPNCSPWPPAVHVQR